ncbi:MAG: hypothetical protein J6A01_06675 [Proteobacteria bacterium]|nr:hypothetical protein [Pseudomonadota bacterium]
MRQIVSLAVCLGVIAVCGCGENGSNPDKEKVTSCSVTDFKPTCVGVISYEVCEERVVVTRSCPSDQKCTDGACTPIQPGERICNDDDYVSECRDLGYTICTDGQLSTIPCQNGETCKAGKCVQGTNTPGVPSGGNPPSGT